MEPKPKLNKCMNFYRTFKYGRSGRIYARILLKLKLTFILLTTVILQVSATGYAQVTLKESATPLEKVIQKIRRQSGYDFFYNAGMLIKARPVTINIRNAEVEEVLELCFKDQPFTYKIEQKTIVIRYLDVVELQNRAIVVRGRIIDETGKPIPGASIRYVGSATERGQTVSSDENGQFRIVVPSEKTVLVISFVGYKTQEVKLRPGQPPLTIKMEQAENKMNEVVISTGIFRKTDKSFTGASTTVTAKELQQFGNRNLITSLRNIDPSFNLIESNMFGNNPNRMPEIQIRGNSSIPNVNQLEDQTRVGLNTPLIILDGFQSTVQKMLDINENEVESITILKDASATAIYGSRGSNGVVVITTKAPRPGKLRITYRGDVTVEAPDLSAYQLLNGRDKLELERRAGYFDHTTSGNGESDRAEDVIRLQRYYNYLLNEVNSGVNTDWLSMPTRTSVGQKHNLRLEGGDTKFRYAASAQYNDVEGVMKGSNRKTFNGAITLSYLLENVKFRNNLQIADGNSAESPYGKFSDFVKMNPYWRPYDSDGNVIKELGYPGSLDYTGYWRNLPVNPLYDATLNTFDKSSRSEITNNTSVEWTIMKDILFRAQLGLSKRVEQTDRFRPADHTAFTNYAIEDFFRRGDYKYGISNAFAYDGSLNLSYTKVFGGKHTVFAGADYNMRQDKGSAYNFLTEGYSNADLDFMSTGLQYEKNGKPSGYESLSRAIGLTGNLNYIYDNRYFADVSMRIDGSSQFGTSKRFAPFWSTGIGWNIHNEAFFKGSKVVNRLKLRGSAGITGSQNFSAYQSLSTYQYYTDDRYFNWNGAYLLGLGNKDLQWQQAMKYNIGVDAEFLNSRLRLTGDYYIENTNDLISSVNLPASNGFDSYIANIGRMRNKGFEIKATGYVMSRPQQGFFWSVSAALIQNRNRVLETSQAMKDAQRKLQNDTGAPQTLYVEGYSSNAIWVVPSLGIDPSTGKELYLGKDGLPTYVWRGKDVVAVGSTDPKYRGNFSTMVRYKSLSMNAVFGYRFGGQQYNQTLIDKVETTSYKYNVDQRVYDSRWQQPGDQAAFKGLLVNSPTFKTSRFVQDENTITCQNINLQYDLRSKYLLKNMGMEALSFSASMADAFYISTVRQERGTSYPFSRQFSLSINATF